MKHIKTSNHLKISKTFLALFALLIAAAPYGVRAHSCNAHFAAFHSSYSSLKFNFSAYYNSTGATYAWDFGDLTTATGTSRNATHTYTATGAYNVCLTVTRTDAAGTVICTDSYCDSIHILPPPPPVCNAQFDGDQIGYSLDAKFKGPSNGPVASYLWHFGDASSDSTTTSKYITHTYPGVGAYYACLTVTRTDTSGNTLCSVSYCDSVHILAPPPPVCNSHFAAFHASRSSKNYYFSGGFNAPVATYDWNFGDGTDTITNRNTSHTYAAAGDYWVCLTVTRKDTSGTLLCSTTTCDSIHISPPPPICGAAFTHGHYGTSLKEYFLARPNPMGTKYLWDFGDLDTSTSRNPAHTYAAAGAYYACLTVTTYDTSGNVICTGTYCDSVHAGAPYHGHREGISDAFSSTSSVFASVYPNPVTNNSVLHIENTVGAVTLRVFENTGRLVMQNDNLENGDFDFNKDKLPSGFYIYRIIDSENNLVDGKLIIQ